MRISRTGTRTITMTEALLKLHAWLSPGYPVGAYTYSHGLEWAVSSEQVRDIETAKQWISDCLRHGAGRSDAILLAHAWRTARDGDEADLEELSELAEALAPSTERLLETQAQGSAFADVTRVAWPADGKGGEDPHPTHSATPYPIVVGRAAAEHGITLDQALPLYCQAFVTNLVSAAVRLVPLGQTQGARIVAGLMPLCLSVAAEAEAASLDDIGGFTLGADIASMRHETLDTRLFRS